MHFKPTIRQQARLRADAEAHFVQSEVPKADVPHATGDYHDAQRATLRNMHRLKALRLARKAPSGR